MEWGKNNECRARELYEVVNSCTVSPSGFYTHVSGALGGTPNGEIRQQKKLIEIKCPFSKRDCKNLNGLVDNGAYFIKRAKKTGQLFLDLGHPQGHAYWHQVQTCLFLCAWAESCDFVIWTPHDLLVVNVPKADQWEAANVIRLLKIWHQHWVPYILKHGLSMVSYIFST